MTTRNVLSHDEILALQAQMKCDAKRLGELLEMQDSGQFVGDLKQIYERAVEVLGSDAAARSWMRMPAFGLGGQQPIGANLQDVLTLLTRIEYGVYT